MGLTYDGITYRSLEEQVRYDAEQVQLLKQADVTINESLQTVNTEIDGKLTKPTNPSEESAVTMLADGTVGTKLLSEIGGGGGKLYLHSIKIHKQTAYTLTLKILSSYSTAYTSNDLDKIVVCPIVLGSQIELHSQNKTFILKLLELLTGPGIFNVDYYYYTTEYGFLYMSEHINISDFTDGSTQFTDTYIEI